MKKSKKILWILLLALLPSLTHAQLESGFHYKIKNNYQILPWTSDHPLHLKYKKSIGFQDITLEIPLLEADYHLPKLLEGGELVSIQKVMSTSSSDTVILLKYRKEKYVTEQVAIKEYSRKQYSKWLWPSKLKANITPSEEKGEENILIVDFWGFEQKKKTEGAFQSTDTTSLDSTQGVVYIDPSFPINKNSYFFLEINRRKTLGDVKKYRSFPYATWEWGVTTIPLKFRNGGEFTAVQERPVDAPNDWQPETVERIVENETSVGINAGLYFGRKWGRNRFYDDKSRNHKSFSFEVAGFFGPTAVGITKNNSTEYQIIESTQLAASYG
ncbi:hypothetical protein SAMN04489724_1093 [Algoriphagus locisalis]|uniref:Uncharacterized protein n=1 Tax=Algoriphagus locisalis TaxID=305507 RepID=A0A1I6YLS9_9BACT|nr:hypothetical protein [Algoriphagus locisalis]SFT51449.1 hypothetical protein SAMN04489724_1093 [Algoriphagus locisalis]